MKKLACVFLVVTVAHYAIAADSALNGKWSMKRTNSEGRVSSQQLNISGDKMTFELRNADGELRLFAKANFKTEKAGPFKYFVLSDIEGGRSDNDLQSVDDTRTSVYTLREGKLIVASNFDRERDNERPSMDVYTRSESSGASAKSTTDTDKLVGTWDMELNVGDNAIDYKLQIKKVDGKLEATQISPRSGEHKFKSIAFADGQVTMEIDREIEGNPTTLKYTGKLADSGLSGKVAVKGNDDFSATWKATR